MIQFLQLKNFIIPIANVMHFRCSKADGTTMIMASNRLIETTLQYEEFLAILVKTVELDGHGLDLSEYQKGE